ncbi:MAG: putative rane protein [Myxococcaceae bacterium]|nr:putative rane protein [Myxococcaceae bacterium]
MNASRFHPWVPDVARGLRAALATLVPFYFATKLGLGELAWTALGGWLGTLADPGGTRATRAKVLVAFTIAGAVAVTVSEGVAGSALLATLVLGATAFGASLLRPLGAAAWTPATLVAVVVAVGSARGGGASHVRDGLFFALGAGWAVVLTSVVWPVWNYLPIRRAIAGVFGELAAQATEVEALALGTAEGDARWTELARKRHRSVRAAIEVARELVLAERARRTGEARVGSNLRVLLGLAEAQVPLLVTLATELEALPPSLRPPREARCLEELAVTDRAIEAVLVTPVIKTSATLLSPPQPTPHSEGGVRPPVLVLASRLAAASKAALGLVHALDASRDETDEPAATARPSALETLRADLRRLRDALSSKSTFLRHGLRVAGAVTVASLVGQTISSHPHWVTVTTLSVLQPYPGATMSRAAQRVVGTVLGSVVAVVITMTIHNPIALALVMVPLSVAAVATQPRSYRLFTFFLTPVFVLLAERSQGDWWTAAARAGDAVVGGLIALVAAVVVFPSRESAARMPEALSTMTNAVLAYADLVLASFDHRREPDVAARIAACRRTAGVAIGEAETSLERLLGEPRHDANAAARALELVTYVRRTASALTSIDTYAAAGLSRASTGTIPEAVRVYVHAVLARLATPRSSDAAPLDEEPELAPDFDPHLGAALRRLLRHTSLLAASSPAHADPRSPQEGDLNRQDAKDA